MIDSVSPLHSLQTGRWFKLICGASYQHIPAIRNFAIVYALAGADCIDVAADPAIVATVRSALAMASKFIPAAQNKGFFPNSQPWVMVSLNDGEDPHFRKAAFDPNCCPSDCPRPCERICPANAIVFNSDHSGVIDALCYGCGRCLNICPIAQITANAYVYSPEMITPLIFAAGIDAIEIHTQIGRVDDFQRLWQALQPQVDQLQLIAVSCPDGEGLIDYLKTLYEIMSPLPCALIWQTDGRPMSGDIGDGATRACLRLGQKVLAANLPGFVQLAGGTNASTVAKAQAQGLVGQLAGIAYGSYARTLLQPLLTELEGLPISILDRPDLLWSAVDLAHELVSQIKGR